MGAEGGGEARGERAAAGRGRRRTGGGDERGDVAVERRTPLGRPVVPKCTLPATSGSARLRRRRFAALLPTVLSAVVVIPALDFDASASPISVIVTG